MMRNKILERLKENARNMKRDVAALYLACRSGDIPWYAKAVAAVTVAYALSPVDLIPDFVPVLGYLDDLVLIPLGIALAVKLIPPEIMAKCRLEAENRLKEGLPRSLAAGVLVVGTWAVIITAIVINLLK